MTALPELARDDAEIRKILDDAAIGHRTAARLINNLGRGELTSEKSVRRYRKNRKPKTVTVLPSASMKMKKLVIDIETSPNLVWSFQLFRTTIPQDHIVQPSRMLCFAARWAGTEERIFRSEFHHGHQEMVRDAHELLSEADYLIHYNGVRFDEKRMNGEFELAGLGPAAPFQRADLWNTIVRRFDFPSSKLAYIAPLLGVGAKEHNSGFSLWLRCLEGDPEAWAEMQKYCMGDVDVTHDLFFKLLPWIPGIPSEGAFQSLEICPTCGSAELFKQGFAFTKTGKYRRYRCNNGHWSRDTHRVNGTGRTQIAL